MRVSRAVSGRSYVPALIAMLFMWGVVLTPLWR
jgi:hypothetical protein